MSETGSDQFVLTNALMDTGSDLTIVPPKGVRELMRRLDRVKVRNCGWQMPQQHRSTEYLAEIDVSNSLGEAAGTALVMPMNGYDLLLGNNLLRQFGILWIEYTTDGYQITLGEKLLVGAVEEEKNPFHSELRKAVRFLGIK